MAAKGNGRGEGMDGGRGCVGGRTGALGQLGPQRGASVVWAPGRVSTPGGLGHGLCLSRSTGCLFNTSGCATAPAHTCVLTRPCIAAVSLLQESFEYFINQRANKPAELIAKFIDARLKAGGRSAAAAGAGAAAAAAAAAGGVGAGVGGVGGSEEELEAALDRALVLFRWVQGREGPSRGREVKRELSRIMKVGQGSA